MVSIVIVVVVVLYTLYGLGYGVCFLFVWVCFVVFWGFLDLKKQQNYHFN